MTVGPVTVQEDADVSHATAVFADTRWKSLPVVRGHRLVGVISRSDIVRAMATPDAEIQLRVMEDFAAIGHEEWEVEAVKGAVTVRGPRPGREARLAAAVTQTTPGVRHVVVQLPGDEAQRQTRLELGNRRRWPRSSSST